jgi:predicted Rossmann fold flavoprotein
MSKIGVIGGGPAGMMAAIVAARNGNEVHLFEKNEKLGKKLYITGKGRCNLTNACEIDELLKGILTNFSFLYSSFYNFSNEDTMTFFEECGVALKVERGSRVFPQSDHSSDIINALRKRLEKLKVSVHLNAEVKDIITEEVNNEDIKQTVALKGVRLSEGKEIRLDACIITTGGLSYPSTGSTGDGYEWAKRLGHQVTNLYPALVPMEVKEEDVKSIQGLSLRNVKVKIYDQSKVLYEEFGEMLLTHFGVTGPIILSASSVVGKILMERNLTLSIDLKPALSFEQLDQRILREIKENSNRQFKNGIGRLFPSSLAPVIIERSGISPEKVMNSVTKEERHEFVNIIKGFTMTLTGLRPIDEGIITKGGVNVKEVDTYSMESKLVKNLYFAGEVLDIDAITGGFNLQIAWSTGYLAGASV